MKQQEYFYNTIEKEYLSLDERLFNPSTDKIFILDKWNEQKISYKNRLIDKPISIGGSNGISGDASGWWDAVQKMGAWYQENVHTYQGTREKPRRGRTWYDCPLIGRKVQDDCSSFVWACLQYFNPDVFKPRPWSPSCLNLSIETSPNGIDAQQLKEAGFKWFRWKREDLQVGDIMVGSSLAQGGTHCGHTEIYAGNNKSYSWGSVHDGQGGKQGLPCGSSFSKGGGLSKAEPYYDIWRLV